MKYTYLLIDFFTIIVPFLFSFHPRLKFHKTWRSFFPAVLITGLVFVLGDVYFTHLGVWGFNPTYLIGITIGNMPIEEILFFLCIPFSCVFTYHCLNILLKLKLAEKTTSLITYFFIAMGFVGGFYFLDQLYTTVTLFSLALLLIAAKFVLKVYWLDRFYLVYLILLFPFTIVNGLLTGTMLDAPVVWYNSNEIIGVRMLTIPVEDIFYGMNLILLNLLIYFNLEKRFSLANHK
jgi:lycopene cyclase domain-containing protein